MQNQISIFDFNSTCNVRVVTLEGEPWFVGKDVCLALGYADSTNAIKQHCRGVVKRHPIVDALNRAQEVRILSEADTLRLIIGSRLPAAQEFERLVFEEVLPSIRKTGAYNAKQSPPWKIPDSELVKVSGAERDELLRLASLACTYFRYKRKASWWLGTGFAKAFGHSIQDTPRWQYTAAHHWLEDILAKAHQFTDQVDSFERLFWSGVGELSPQASVAIDTKRGVVFHDPVRERRLHAPA